MNQIISDNSIHSMMSYLENKLQTFYDARESRNIAFRLFEHYLSLPKAEVILRKAERISESQMLQLHFALKRLLQHEPLQYILGYEYFRSLKFNVNSDVLIPRPETEELVQCILDDFSNATTIKLIDIGTGSGCIPISIKKERPNWNVSAVDISASALATAELNSKENQCDVAFTKQDILDHDYQLPDLDIIVSNPPYIPFMDKEKMRKNVLDYEPHLALFVEDNEPLIFYKRILFKAKNLASKPSVYFEIHEDLKPELTALLESEGINNYTFIKDLQEKYRILRIKL
jgi:release factor glutamine methyltransferase